MEFRWEVGKWPGASSETAAIWGLHFPLAHFTHLDLSTPRMFFCGEKWAFPLQQEIRETRNENLKTLPVGTQQVTSCCYLRLIYDLKNPRKVLCYQKLDTFSIWPGSSCLQSWPQLLTVDACHRTPCARRAPRALVNSANACPGGAMSQVWHPSDATNILHVRKLQICQDDTPPSPVAPITRWTLLAGLPCHVGWDEEQLGYSQRCGHLRRDGTHLATPGTAGAVDALLFAAPPALVIPSASYTSRV